MENYETMNNDYGLIAGEGGEEWNAKISASYTTVCCRYRMERVR